MKGLIGRKFRVPEHRGEAERVPIHEMAFWPTYTGSVVVPIQPPVLNCQRCGREVSAGLDWWCDECHRVVWWLQQSKLMTMVQIARSGEIDATGDWASAAALRPEPEPNLIGFIL